MIPGLGKSPGEGTGFPLQYSWASLVAQTVKNQPTMRETWVDDDCWENLLEKGTAMHSWRIPREFPRQRSLAGYISRGCKELGQRKFENITE